jgi:hypothetical protein
MERTARLKALRLAKEATEARSQTAPASSVKQTALTAAMKRESASELATSWSVGRSA